MKFQRITKLRHNQEIKEILSRCGAEEWRRWWQYLPILTLMKEYTWFGEIVPGVCVYVALSLPKSKAVKVEVIAVVKEEQGKGVGTQMLERIKLQAQGQGASKITLTTNPTSMRWWKRNGAVVTGRSRYGGYKMEVLL